MNNFNPDVDAVDQKLLYLLTGRGGEGCMGDWLDSEVGEALLSSDGPNIDESVLGARLVDRPVFKKKTSINEN